MPDVASQTSSLIMSAEDDPMGFDVDQLQYLYMHQQIDILQALVRVLRREVELRPVKYVYVGGDEDNGYD